MPSASIGLMCTCDEDPVPSKAAPATPKAAPAVSKAAPVASSASITAQPPDQKTKLNEYKKTILTTYRDLLLNERFKNRDTGVGYTKALDITKSIKVIYNFIREAVDILKIPTPTAENLDTAKHNIESAQGALNQILTDLKIPESEIKPVELVSTQLTLGGRRTRRKGKGSKKRTRRARRRHR